MWLEDFYWFCQECNPLTQEVMNDLLTFDADMMSLGIVYNSFANKEFFDANHRQSLRRKLIPKMGHLYQSNFEGLCAVSSLE